MKKNKRFWIYVLFLLFLSCDYVASYRFVIVNRTSHEVLIRTAANIYDNGFYFYDSIYTIKQGEKIEFTQDLGLSNKSYIPEDAFMPNDTLPEITKFKFDIYVNGELNKELRLRSYWVYESETRMGTYTLYIVK